MTDSQPIAAEVAAAIEAAASLAISDTTAVEEAQATPPSTETLTGAVSASAVPAHLSHDPTSNQKRTDPFMFGQRFLTQEDNVFEYNAWDHVETDDAFKEYSEKQYELQRSAPVSDFDKCEYSDIMLLHVPHHRMQ